MCTVKFIIGDNMFLLFSNHHMEDLGTVFDNNLPDFEGFWQNLCLPRKSTKTMSWICSLGDFLFYTFYTLVNHH